MDNEANQMQQGVAAQSMDAGAAVGAAEGQNPNVGQGQLVEMPPANAQPEHQAPTVEEKLAAQNKANLERAINEGGYKPEAGPNREERARILVADMEHTVANNGPITLAMLRELRELLGVDRA